MLGALDWVFMCIDGNYHLASRGPFWERGLRLMLRVHDLRFGTSGLSQSLEFRVLGLGQSARPRRPVLSLPKGFARRALRLENFGFADCCYGWASTG